MTERTPRGPILALVLVALALLVMILQGCSFAPEYKRPEMALPESYGVRQSPVPAAEQWWKVFNDPVLDKLEDEALASNLDLLAAAERIEQSRAQLRIVHGGELPSVGIEASRNRTQSSQLGSFPLPPDFVKTNDNRLVLQFAWELDFWGKFRNASAAARAEMVASEAGRDAVRSSLVSDVAHGYFALLALDSKLETVQRTRDGRAEALKIQKLRWDAGAISELDYRQVESDLRNAEALVPSIRFARFQQEGVLAMLLGRSPRDVFEAKVDRGISVVPDIVEVPEALPSELLLKRPDVRQAEAQLQAANYRIGVARAAYFPSISLTGFYGGESQALGDIFKGNARTWQIAGGLVQPLFAGGQIAGGVDLANASTREAELAYRKAVANAFREVREAIAAQTERRESYLAQRERENSFARTYELARLRYRNGAIGLLDALDAERNLLSSRLDQIDAERDRRNAIVDLYTALGM